MIHEPTDQERICRLALLEARRIDMPHPKIRGARIVGYVVEPDELYGDGEGLELLHALERTAGVDLEQTRKRLTTFPCD